MEASGGSIFRQKKMGLICGLAVLIGAGAAGVRASTVSCVFTTECIVGDACQETVFDLTVIKDADNLEIAQIETIFGNFHGLYSNTYGNPPENLTAFVPDTGNSYHLTWYASAAWLTLHMPDADMAITYTGTCEAAQ